MGPVSLTHKPAPSNKTGFYVELWNMPPPPPGRPQIRLTFIGGGGVSIVISQLTLLCLRGYVSLHYVKV